jgi:RNA polymerase sigma factor (sigma-70 family)
VIWSETPDVSDALLVISALNGDKSAFASLVGRHVEMARSVVLRLLRNPNLVADVLQEATVAALIGLPRLRSPERFGSWYAGIALNIARRSIREVDDAIPIFDDIVDRAVGPEDQAEAAELAQRVLDAVRELPVGQREAVLAFYWQGLSHAEAARELGIRPAAVKARLHQAALSLGRRLRRRLGRAVGPSARSLTYCRFPFLDLSTRRDRRKEMRWIVAIETASPDDGIEIALQFERMRRLLGRTINAAAVDDDGWSIELTIEAPEPENALANARSEILTISERIGLPQWPWIAIQVVREEYASAMGGITKMDFPAF